jgi:Rps23 Pro-64 3,4-dihydroxylase Tpa1-like proline 4-hydroxylase
VEPLIGESFIDYDLHAAGMHMIPPGGFLASHLDAEYHPIRPWKRTHSIVMSVNSLWLKDWGGSFRADDREIFPECGQIVIFETRGLWHEVTPVLSGTHYRKTLALFAWREATDLPPGRSTSATFAGSS